MHTDITRAFKPTVLIVEDEFLIADELARTFEQAGGSVIGYAASATKAREIVERTSNLTLAVLDVCLADGFTFELADLLRSRGVTLVFYTATEPQTFPARFRNETVIQKPSTAEAVYSEARRALV